MVSAHFLKGPRDTFFFPLALFFIFYHSWDYFDVGRTTNLPKMRLCIYAHGPVLQLWCFMQKMHLHRSKPLHPDLRKPPRVHLDVNRWQFQGCRAGITVVQRGAGGWAAAVPPARRRNRAGIRLSVPTATPASAAALRPYVKKKKVKLSFSAFPFCWKKAICHLAILITDNR